MGMHQTWIKKFLFCEPILQAVKVFGIFRWWKLSCANPGTLTGKKILLLCIDDACSFWQCVCICSVWGQRRSQASLWLTGLWIYRCLHRRWATHALHSVLQPWRLSVSLKPEAWIINCSIGLFSSQRMEQNSKIFLTTLIFFKRIDLRDGLYFRTFIKIIAFLFAKVKFAYT